MYIVEFADRGIILKDVKELSVNRNRFIESMVITLKDGDKLEFELKLCEKVDVYSNHDVEIKKCTNGYEELEKRLKEVATVVKAEPKPKCRCTIEPIFTYEGALQKALKECTTSMVDAINNLNKVIDNK